MGIADLVTMPPKSDSWKCFVVQGVLAVCQLSGCPKPNVSLGALPKPGQKKRITSGAVTNHLAKHHQSEWNAYCETRARKAAVASELKEEVKESCEMENSEVRFYDVRSSKGRLPFLNKILPDVPEPPVYWIDTDPRAEAAHMGIIAQMVLDFQPLSLVNNKGFLIDKRLTLPSLQVHTPWWYQDKIEKVNHHLINFDLIC